MHLLQKLNNKRLILASQSPRRKYLLREAGLSFEVFTRPGDDESFPQDFFKEQIPLYLAEKKSLHHFPSIEADTIVISADTIVWLDNKAVNKAGSREEAVEMLHALSGNIHEVITGVCLRDARKKDSFYSVTKVFFRELSQDEIDFYVDNYQPYDKAGAYGIQEWIGYTGVERVEGCFFNVMGLPLPLVYSKLKDFIG